MKLAQCAADPVYCINNHIKTYDPRRKVDTYLPFKLFPKQEDFIRWIQEREELQEDGLAEKSRDVGFTWLCCAYAWHKWRFVPGSSVGFGSRKLELVDRVGDPDSILEKIRIILRNLPPDHHPQGFDITKHAGHCKIVNPETGATITGEGGDNIGRGGRKTIYFIDEAAFLERPQLIESALSQTSNVKIWVSTPNGSGNNFYKKRFSGNVPVFTFHWRDDPRKDDAWYEKQKKSLDSVTVAQEIDIDYSASIEGVVIPAKWVQAAVKLESVLDAKGLEMPRTGKRYAALDVADEGKNKNVFMVRQGIAISGVEYWNHLNTTQTAYKSKELAEQHKADMLVYDCIGVGAGVKGTYESLEKKPVFDAIPVNVGDPASNTVWPDKKTSKERFANLKAELWWLARLRFEKTFEYVEEGIDHPLDELISIPNEPSLVAQLSQPTYHYNEKGKTQIESKKNMAKRGIASPDFADSFVMVAAPEHLFVHHISLW